MRINLTVPDELLKEFDDYCARYHYDRSAFLQTLIRNVLYGPINPSVPGEPKKEIPTETKTPIIETPIPEEYPVIVTEEKPLESMGWCMLNVAHPFTKGKNYRVFKMTWEDENGTPVVDKKWACPKCIEHYTTIGRGKVSFEMQK